MVLALPKAERETYILLEDMERKQRAGGSESGEVEDMRKVTEKVHGRRG